MISPRRRISRSSLAYRYEIRDLLQSILALEFAVPSDRLWLVSPWVSDIVVLDNSTGRFPAVTSEWGTRAVRFAELLAALIRRGTQITLATRPLPENERFVEQVRIDLRTKGGDLGQFNVHMAELLHEKGLLGQGFHLSGSMNFTMNGIELLQEAVIYETNGTAIAEARLDFEKRWPQLS